VFGAAGRMGRQLLSAIAERDDACLGAAIDMPSSASIGVDSSVLAGGAPSGVVVADSAVEQIGHFDTIIDFTAPAASLHLLEQLADQNKRVVIGTTGFNAQQVQQLHEYATRLPIVFAPNYSIGVTVSLSLLAAAAKALGDDYDVEIIEAHHRHKVDAPSGTALRLGEVVADTLGRSLEADAIYGRHGITGERARQTIGFATVTFARGAVRAATWLRDQPAGLYDMTHVLGLAKTV